MGAQFIDEISFVYATPGNIVAAASVLPALSIVLVSLRFYTRRIQRAQIGIDDWLTLPGLVMVVGAGIALIIGVEMQAMGYPTPVPADPSTEAILNANPVQSLIVQEVEFAVNLLSTLGYGFIKCSIVLFYRRLFVTFRGSIFDYITRGLIVAIVAWTITFFFIWIFACGSHVSANWGSRMDLVTYCEQRLPMSNGFLISDLIIDVITLVLPMPIIWSLKMTLSRKLAVSGVLLIGSIAVAASIARLILAYEVTSAGFDVVVDENLTISTIMYWYMIEAGISLIAACLPTLRFLFANKSLQTVMQSVRSAISLRSSSSHRGDNDFSDIESNHSRAQIYGPGSGTMETSAVGKTDKGLEMTHFPQDGRIHVEHEVSQTIKNT
ncbi:hypothetical protein MMC27_006663 [Xylographa pallens]|nr:hypothetical protein [Xylographa pallens]